MTINPQYFPVFSGCLIFIAVLFLVEGYSKGLVKQIASLVSMIFSILIAWPLAGILSGQFEMTFLNQYVSMTSGQMALASHVVWFVLLLAAFQIGMSIVLAMIGILKKIHIISFADHAAGMVVGALKCAIVFSVISLVLQMPIFTNGQAFVQNSVLGWSAGIIQPIVSQYILERN